MVQAIQKKVQAKLTEQVGAMLKTFLGDFGCLLKHLLKGRDMNDLSNESRTETARVLQVLNNFNLGGAGPDFDSESDNDSDQDVNSEGEKRNRNMNAEYSNSCKC